MITDRTILILTAETGGGHKSISRALSERCEESFPGHECIVVNAYDELLDFPLSLISEAHGRIVRRSPALWSMLFESTSTGKRFSKIEGLTRPWTKRNIEAIFDDLKPAAVISVVPLINELVGEVAHRRGIPFAVVIADMARIHPAWLSNRASLFCAPTDFVKKELTDFGVPHSKILLTGLPARSRFFHPTEDRFSLRSSLGINPNSFAILVMGGGEGVGVSKPAVKELAELPGVELFIFAGRNERLKQRIERLPHDSVRALGFVNNVDEWLKAADLLITKTGPNTLVEAAASGMPTLFVGALPGQEQSIVDHLLMGPAGGDGNVCAPEDLPQRVLELMACENKRRALVSSIERFANPDAAMEVCEAIKNLVYEENYGASVYV